MGDDNASDSGGNVQEPFKFNVAGKEVDLRFSHDLIRTSGQLEVGKRLI
jgi:hypothetical protein